ncbi:MAG: hypothetical protein ACF788_08315, partial [Novipirellula sp. JB048]
MSLSTTASPTPPPSAPREPNAFDNVAAVVESRIDEAQRALWWAELIRSVLRILIGAVAGVLVWVVVDQWLYSHGLVARVLGFITLLAWVISQSVLRVLPVLRGAIRPEYAAYSLERDVPEMRQELTSYVTLRDQKDAPGLHGKVIRSIGAHAASRLRSHDALPNEATGMIRWWLVMAGLLALFVLYAALSPKNSLQSASRLVMPIASIEPAKRVRIHDVLPGNIETLAGRTVEVSAIVEGLRPEEVVVCRWQSQGREAETPLQLDPSSARYLGEITLEHASSGRVPYQIEAGDDRQGPYYLTVQDVPVVAVESVRYQPPAYTQKQPHTSSSAAITALDGTRVTIAARTNRPIEKATIQFNPKPLGDIVHATAGSMEMSIDESKTMLTFSFPLRFARERSSAVQLESYRIKVWDKNAQTNPAPIVYPIRVIADLAPEVTIVMPQHSPKDIPIDAQQIIEIHAADADYGLQRIELEIRRGIELLERATLWSDDRGRKGNQIAEYRFRPHEHFLRVGDAVQVKAIATDNRSDDNDPLLEPNVTQTDPVELRITMSEPVPQEPVAGDGLSAPDQKPAASPEAGEAASRGEQGGASGGDPQSGGESEAGEQSGGSSGGSSGGAGGEAGEQRDADPENGSGESGGSGGSGTQPPSDAQGSQGEADSQDPAGAAGSPDASQGSGQEGSDSNGEMQDSPSGEPPSGEAKPGEGSVGEGSVGDNTAREGQSGADPASGAAAPQGREGSDAQRGESATETEQEGAQQDRAQQDGTGQGGAGQGMSDSSQPSDARQPDAAPNQGGEPSQGGEPRPDESASREPPQHDGEAFERIRDYLDQKQQQQSGQGSQGDPAAKPEAGADAADAQRSGSDGDDPDSRQGSGEGSSADASDSAGQSTDPATGQEAPDNKPAGADSGAGQSDDPQSPTPADSPPQDSKPGETGEAGESSSETDDQAAEAVTNEGASQGESSPQGNTKAGEQAAQQDAESASGSEAMEPQEAGGQEAGNQGARDSSAAPDASASPQASDDQASDDAEQTASDARQPEEGAPE